MKQNGKCETRLKAVCLLQCGHRLPDEMEETCLNAPDQRYIRLFQKAAMLVPDTLRSNASRHLGTKFL